MTPKEDIDALIDWLISEANEGKIEIHNIETLKKVLGWLFILCTD